MKTIYFALLIALFSITTINAQKLAHELGFMAGTVALQSDFSGDTFDNLGFGGGIVYYIGIKSERKHWSDRQGASEQWLYTHLRAKVEVSYMKSKLVHNNLKATTNYQSILIKGISSENKLLNVGLQLEINFFDISAGKSLEPYMSFGGFYTKVNPSLVSEFGDLEENPNLLPTIYKGKGSLLKKESTGSFTFGFGTRYYLNEKTKLVLDYRFQRFLSDHADGIAPLIPSNKMRDWLGFLNVGVVFNIN